MMKNDQLLVMLHAHDNRMFELGAWAVPARNQNVKEGYLKIFAGGGFVILPKGRELIASMHALLLEEPS